MASSVILQPEALDPDQVPETLQHRDGELDVLRAALDPLTYGHRPDNVVLFGPSGVGKTTIAKWVVGSLNRTVSDLKYGFVDVMDEGSRRDILYRLAADCEIAAGLRREGTSAAAILDRFRETEEPVVAIVDEIQFLDDLRVLGTLFGLSNVACIAITLEQHEWLATMEDRMASRIRSAETITLGPYGPDELADIVDHRIGVGLESQVIAPGAVEAIASRAGGDARVAISMLRSSARRVESGAAEAITPAVVADVEEDVQEAILERYREQLGTYKRLLYDIISDAGEIQAEDVHQEFLERVQGSPPAKRTRRGYLQGLRAYGLIEKEGNARATTYRLP